MSDTKRTSKRVRFEWDFRLSQWAVPLGFGFDKDYFAVIVGPFLLALRVI